LTALSDGAVGGNAIQLRTDFTGNSLWTVYMATVDGVDDARFDTSVPAADKSGTWQIDWALGQVLVYHNNVLAFDSAVNAPTAGSSLVWNIPQVAMRPLTLMFADGAMDSVLWESVVPEPSTVMLLGLGGLLCWRRRRS
ncbi:MAG: PEP-CTERM sorting domain-containing protein, partial [Acidobacteria bacterium]|nr:PEP-CTERM sorting domain-containing protein [Acidobacteriota bacterium]